MLLRQWLPLPLAILLAFTLMPAVSSAAYLELSTTAKKALDRTADGAAATAGSRIRTLYGDFLASQKEEKRLDEAVKSLRTSNAAKESALRRSIREVDAAVIERLAAEVKRKKEAYKPLFDGYTLLNKQISAARSLGDKELNALLRMQANAMKLKVELARADIRLQESKLKDARAAAAAKIKELRAMLDVLGTHKSAIQALKETASRLNKRKSAEWSVLNERVRKGDVAGTSSSLATLLSASRGIADAKGGIQRRETSIADQLRKTETRLAALRAPA